MFTAAKLSLTLALAVSLQAAVKLPALISDHMVLQAGVPVRIWGSSDPGSTVRIVFQGQDVYTRTAPNGKWAAWLKPLAAAGPLDMTISWGEVVRAIEPARVDLKQVTLHDILVGEVWLGSGQSNMEFNLSNANNHDDEIAHADYPLIHIFRVKRAIADQPADDVEGSWQVSSPQTIGRFSAVEYFFGRELHQSLHVPIGLIESDWGGTPAQAWTSRERLESDPALKYVWEEWERAKSTGQEPRYPSTPASLYNGMIAPLTPYTIRGVIWYQGEANATEAQAFRYRRLFTAMIQDWRSHWGEGDFPFLFVQLANFKSNEWWPILRESQTETLHLNNTGMAVAIDIGESRDIHPKNKQDVGHRLALAARHIVYGQQVEYSGPMYRQITAEGSQMRLWFDHAAGLEAKSGGALTGFTIAGADGAFVPADARIDSNTVVVSNPAVSNPISVRYAWADDPVCNLINHAGLPASPFRTDR
jgi:sialate O-acetylesterase